MVQIEKRKTADGTLHVTIAGKIDERFDGAVVLTDARGKSRLRIPLPIWLSPGTTHVEHADESNGWFRFTMTVTHPLFGEVFYQTGRFRAAREPS